MKHAGKFTFETRCVESTYEDMRALLASEQSISLATFRLAIGLPQWRILTRALGYDRGFPIRRDWHVGYYQGQYRGAPAYFLRWSGIEHIYTHGELGPSLAKRRTK